MNAADLKGDPKRAFSHLHHPHPSHQPFHFQQSQHQPPHFPGHHLNHNSNFNHPPGLPHGPHPHPPPHQQHLGPPHSQHHQPPHSQHHPPGHQRPHQQPHPHQHHGPPHLPQQPPLFHPPGGGHFPPSSQHKPPKQLSPPHHHPQFPHFGQLGSHPSSNGHNHLGPNLFGRHSPNLHNTPASPSNRSATDAEAAPDHSNSRSVELSPDHNNTETNSTSQTTSASPASDNPKSPQSATTETLLEEKDPNTNSLATENTDSGFQKENSAKADDTGSTTSAATSSLEITNKSSTSLPSDENSSRSSTPTTKEDTPPSSSSMSHFVPQSPLMQPPGSPAGNNHNNSNNNHRNSATNNEDHLLDTNNVFSLPPTRTRSDDPSVHSIHHNNNSNNSGSPLLTSSPRRSFSTSGSTIGSRSSRSGQIRSNSVRIHPAVPLPNSLNSGSNTSPTFSSMSPVLKGNFSSESVAHLWTGLDMSGTGLRQVTDTLFRLTHLTKLYLNRNNLTFIPSDIALLSALTILDLSQNKLRSLPEEIGQLSKLEDLNLRNNALTTLPYEMGRLYALKKLRLLGNPLAHPLQSLSQKGTAPVLTYLLDNSQIAPAPPERTWIRPRTNEQERVKEDQPTFSVFCYNVLCDKFATRQVYGYCPTWALNWEYRRQQILRDLVFYNSDICCLQEVETSEFYDFFEPEMREKGFEALFRPKSRARTMGDEDRKSVDGCAIFYRASKFKLEEDQVLEFARLSTSYAGGCTDVLNRVMPKDNIAILSLLEHIETGQQVFVANAHLTWDPIYKDVKVVQSVLLMHEIKSFLNGKKVPMIICGDLNSMPDSGVYAFMRQGKIDSSHDDLADHDYERFFENVPSKHPFGLRSAYTGELPFTNFTRDFTGVIDYIWYSQEFVTPTALLGPVSKAYMDTCDGCPNPHFASDHICLAAEFNMLI
eukprot:m.143924 g.143924  ORF g.143924 m.143924 type:complete len:933 (+) comp24231_c0_seq1:223-3021(+)